MATIRNILKGLYIGLWNFCFPYQQEKHRQRIYEYVLRKERLEWMSLNCSTQGVASTDGASKPIIISLTTHGKRIHTVHRVIECLFQQSLKVQKIVLYLSNEEVQSIDQLPQVLQRQMLRGLDIRFVRDLRSYTKLLPALKEFPEATIITVDDDIFYPLNMIERLIRAHFAHPGAICSLVNRKLFLNADGKIGNYNDFPFETVCAQDVTSTMIVPEGFGGVLYPPHSFPEEVFNEAQFMQLSPSADDLWFKAMSLIAHTPVVKVHSFFDFLDEFIPDMDVQDIGLRNMNLDKNANNLQFKALFEHYNLYQYL